ncbi:hypothetical protein HOH87_02980 [bacterium]|jgi:cytochrome c oxidase subunit IV|nr:hypothetical protein [bacterium]
MSGHFIIPVSYYVKTFIGLLFLTFITVLAAQFDFGALNLTIALLIAVVKASLVLLIFMGLRWEKGFTWVLLLGSVVCVLIFFFFVFADLMTRGAIDIEEAGFHDLKSPVIKIEKGHAPTGH